VRSRLVLWFLSGLLLGPAALLTAARLSGSDAGPVVRAVSFAPAGVPLYAAALVLLLVLAAWRGRRRLPLAVAVVAVGGLGLHVAWVAPWYVGASAAVSSSDLRLMTANLLGDQGDGPGLVAAASDADVDVLAVQELSTATLADMDAAGLAELFPYRAGEADPTGGVLGTMVFAREPVTDVVRLPTVMGSWSVRVGETSLFALHPAYPLDVADWRAEHAALLDSALDLGPDLMLGDFNATLDHAPMRRLLDAGYRDATELSGSGFQPTWPATGDGLRGLLPPVVQIDHVLVHEGWTAARTWTVGIDGTDHRALVAEVGRA
jgi:endonuclease/exonuclease/phosphatase (EEP) superfamily protein YafD